MISGIMNMLLIGIKRPMLLKLTSIADGMEDP